MPKNKHRNAFCFFMIEWKNRAEARGQTFPNGLKDVQANPDCNEQWRNLTKQQKGPYEALAKQDKVRSQGTMEKKTTLGESIPHILAEEKEKQDLIIAMEENIKSTVDTAVNLNILPKIKFCFMHVNWFFSRIVNNCIEYFPAEYALGVFSLEKGIEDVHHVIVSSKIPLGYLREAMAMSQETHQIPVEHTGGETDFTVMYEKLVEFLKPRKLVDKYPPIYVRQNCIGAVRSVLTKLSIAAGQEEEQFRIYEIESLFKHIAYEAYKARTDRQIKYIPAYALHVFTRVTYIFETGFECPFHKYVDRGSEYCSKSVLQQWAWTMCDEFCRPLKVEMRPGVHCPIKSDFNPCTLTSAMRNLNVENNQSESESLSILSMTGVSEQHKIKVSARTYQDEMRRRCKSQPVKVIDYSEADASIDESNADESNNESLNKSIDTDDTDEQRKRRNLMHYLSQRRVQSLDTDSTSVTSDVATVEDLIPNNFENFPPIGGRGVTYRSKRTTTMKAPLGRGQGHT